MTVSPRLIGRTGELAAILAAYERACSDHTVTVLLSGEAGIGKTHLVQTALAGLPGNPLVLVGGCLELGTAGLPYAAFTNMMGCLVRRMGPDWNEVPVGPALSEWLAGDSTVVARPGRHDFMELEPAAKRSRLLQELVSLVEHLAAEQPVVLLVEDLHWADDASRDLFVHLARNLPGAVLLIGTVRTGELAPRHPVRQLLGELGRRADVVTIDLGPLVRAEVAAQLAALRGKPADPSLTAAIHRRSGGNPLFVESLSDSDGTGPVSLRGLLLERVARLPASARVLLSTAAGAGARVSDQLLASVTGLSDNALRDALRILVERGQLITEANGYAFRHDLIREAVYTDLLPMERRRLHRRFAEALRDSDDQMATDRVPELARHWAAAGVAREALIAAWQAASIHRSRTAFGEELRELETVLDHWYAVPAAAVLIGADRLDVLEQAIAAAIAGGSTLRGLAHAEEALAAVDPLPHPERRAILLCQQARLLNRLDATGQQAIAEALSLIPPGRNDDVRRLVLAHSIGVGTTEAGGNHLTERTAELTELARRADDPLGLAWSHAGRLLQHVVMDGDLDGGHAEYEAALPYAEAAGDEHVLLTLHLWRANGSVLVEEFEDALTISLPAVKRAEKVGLRSRATLLALSAAVALSQLGRWTEAEQLLDDALAEEVPPLFGASVRGFRAEIAIARGDLLLAQTLIDATSEVVASGVSAARFLYYTELVKMELEVALGDPEAADRTLGTVLSATGTGWPPADAYRIALDGLRVQRARRAAAPRNQAIATQVAARRSALASLVDHLKEPVRGHLPYLLTIRAETGPGKLADWDTAAEAWRSVDSPYQAARVLTAAAAVALADSNQAGARARLRDARELADALGAVTLRAQIDELSSRAGLGTTDQTTRRDIAGRYGLTRREHDVLRALARGLSNRQIATELFVSPNTAGTHVTRIFTKLGVSSRAEATALALRENLV